MDKKRIFGENLFLKISFLCFSLFFVFFYLSASDKSESFIIMSYNVENLFDTKKDSLKKDGDFTPEGQYHWTYSKYKKKIADIAKVIAAVGEWQNPALVGLCEIENQAVLWDLIRNSPLENQGYSFLHFESPDVRGIDVALLYQKDKFSLIRGECIRIKNPEMPDFVTRDILHAQGIVPTGDTLHVFVNHWPSRLGGELESEHKRLYVASVLKDKIEEINKTTHNPKIVIMGDFNDSPENKSLKVILGAENPQDSLFLPKNLYNLSYPFHDKGDIGTHKRLGEWAVLDQIIVSGTLLDDKNRFYTTKQNIYIYTPWFLKEPDEKNIGFKPFRMYQGFKYNGGISDHFPVFVKFFMQMDLE